MRLVAVALLALVLAACERTFEPAAEIPNAVTAAVEARIGAVDTLRIRNAATLEPGQEVTLETFGAVCRPVGMRLRALAEETGWTVRQVAERYRNPDHAPDPEAEAFFDRFADEPNLTKILIRTTHDGTPGYRYLRRIDTQGSCLACHGARDERPAFVVEDYPEDRAYGFAPGELRGVYSVFVPDSLATLALLPAR